MKKLLGLLTIGLVLVLAACNGGGSSATTETVCRISSELYPHITDISVIESVDGNVTTIAMGEETDLTGMDENEVAYEITWASSQGANCERDGNTLTCMLVPMDLSNISVLGDVPVQLDEFISELQAEGFNCSN